MMKIRDILVRDFEKTRIEEIVKVDQMSEEAIHEEIREYIATNSIKKSYKELLTAIAESPSTPHEGIGVWISGFFGSGKSFFAKNLGNVLANKKILGTPFSELFKKQMEDTSISDLVDLINTKIPTEVIMFDVSADRAVKSGDQTLAEIMYTVLLSELDYAVDFDIAELEIELENEGELKEFVQLCEKKHWNWSKVRKGAQKTNRASQILHEMNPKTYPSADSWAKAKQTKADITVKDFVERTFDLMSRRRPGKALTFIIDEVGQFVARSEKKIENLRAIIEQFGKVSKNKIKKGEATAPVWIIVTSQEKLNEVVAAIDSKRVILAKLQDRFKYRIDLKPEDIQEVASKRVLAKKEGKVSHLKGVFSNCEGRLNQACQLENTSRKCNVHEEDFIQFYPYLPHYIDLSITIMSGIRLQPGAPKHLGGSNRTIIKQAYEMMINDRTKIANKEVGTLVCLDMIYELIEGNLTSEKLIDLNEIMKRYVEDKNLAIWAPKVAKAVCLLEFVRDLPRTPKNIAAFLVDNVDQSAPVEEVKKAIVKLVEDKFIKNTEEGYKLQSMGEKDWESERRGIGINGKHRNNIKRETVGGIFVGPHFRTIRYNNIKNFKIGVSIDKVEGKEKGQIPIHVRIAEDEKEFPNLLEEVRKESRLEHNKSNLYYVFPLSNEVDNLIENVHRSTEMIGIYDRQRSQNRINREQASCLENEKSELNRYKNRLQEKLLEAMSRGRTLFRGVSEDASDLGGALSEIIKAKTKKIIPELYPKLEIGACSLKGDEAEKLLKAANLNNLPAVFYDKELVKKEGTKSVLNTSAPVAVEILNYIVSKKDYGEIVTGKMIDAHFGGIGYAWERGLLRMVLAVLMRAGSIEVTYQGNKYRDYTDTQSRVPLTNNTAFKSSSFAPRKAIGLSVTKSAVENFEKLTGTEVDMQTTEIAKAIKKFTKGEMERLYRDLATARAESLLVIDLLDAYKKELDQIIDGDQDDCVEILASKGEQLKETREKVMRIQTTITDKNLAELHKARSFLLRIWPTVEGREDFEDSREDAGKLLALHTAEDFYEHFTEMKKLNEKLAAKFRDVYSNIHKERTKTYKGAISEFEKEDGFSKLKTEEKNIILHPMKGRACDSLDVMPGEAACKNCRAMLGQMESDITALDGLKRDAVIKLQVALTPKQRIERIRLTRFFGSSISNKEELEKAIEKFRAHLLKLLKDDAKIVLE